MVERNVEMERELTDAAAKTVRISINDNGTNAITAPPTLEINDFADRRAGMEPIRPETLDNGVREAREEAADFRNYIVWRILYRQNSPEATERLGQALGHVIAAYHLISLVEEAQQG